MVLHRDHNQRTRARQIGSGALWRPSWALCLRWPLAFWGSRLKSEKEACASLPLSTCALHCSDTLTNRARALHSTACMQRQSLYFTFSSPVGTTCAGVTPSSAIFLQHARANGDRSAHRRVASSSGHACILSRRTPMNSCWPLIGFQRVRVASLPPWFEGSATR